MQFLNPWFLIGLIAVAIPIAIHLFTFRRYKKEYFSSIDLLKELKSETKKQSQLKHLLILACRILCIIALVFTFAQPFIPYDKQSTEKGSSVISIYVDNSFSMQSSGTNGNLLNQAKDKVREILDAYELGDLFQLITNDLQAQHERFLSKEDLLKELDNLQFSSNTQMLSNIVKRQKSLLDKYVNANKYYYLISDFQKSTSDLSLIEKDSTAAFYLIPLKSEEIANLYIDSIWFETPVFRKNSQLKTLVKIVNEGEKGLEKIPVKLFINGKERAFAGLDIEAGEQKTVELPFTVETTGILEASVKINDHPITFDDEMFFSLNIQKEISVLNVSPERNKYLDFLFQKDSGIFYKTLAEKEIPFGQLNKYNFIILNGLKNFSSGLAQEIGTFVENGGSVLILPPQEILPQSNYTSSLQILNTPWFGSLDTAKLRISDLNIQAELYRNVFSSKPKDLAYPSVYKHFEILSGASTNKESLLKMENGKDFITQSKKGKGKIYLMASPLDENGSDFVKHSLFVPSVFNMALLSTQQRPVYYIIGQNRPIEIPNAIGRETEVLKIKEESTSFEFIPEMGKMQGQNVIFANGQIQKAGIYHLYDDKVLLDALAFNYNRKESNMETLTLSQIQKDLDDLGLQNVLLIKDTQNPITSVIKMQKDGAHLWKLFAVICLFSLLAEMALLRFFKNKTSKS